MVQKNPYETGGVPLQVFIIPGGAISSLLPWKKQDSVFVYLKQ